MTELEVQVMCERQSAPKRRLLNTACSAQHCSRCFIGKTLW